MSRTAIVKLIIICELDQEYFAPWDELSPEQQAIFTDRSCKCDDENDFGPFCIDCDFCENWELLDWYFEEKS